LPDCSTETCNVGVVVQQYRITLESYLLLGVSKATKQAGLQLGKHIDRQEGMKEK